MRVLVDGYNLIRRTPLVESERLGLEASRDRLIELLRTYRRRRGHQVTVVFDGTAHSQGVVAGVTVVYAPSADAAIGRLVRSGDMVVSSDREVALSARQAGATFCSAEEFWRRLAGASAAANAHHGGPDPRSIRDKGDEEEDSGRPKPKKGTARRAPKAERQRRSRLNKL